MPGVHLGADAVIAEVGYEQAADDPVDGLGDEHGQGGQGHIGGYLVLGSYACHIFGKTGGEQQFAECKDQDLGHDGHQIRLGACFNSGNHIVPFNGNSHENKGKRGDGHAHDHQADGGEASQQGNEKNEA